MAEIVLVLLGVLAGLVVLATAVVGLMAARNARQARDEAKKIGVDVQQVHVLVNSRLSTALARLDQLTEALQGSDTAVPPVPHDRKEDGDGATG